MLAHSSEARRGVSDARDRIADDRDRIADGRDRIADERDDVADEQERDLDRRQAELRRLVEALEAESAAAVTHTRELLEHARTRLDQTRTASNAAAIRPGGLWPAQNGNRPPPTAGTLPHDGPRRCPITVNPTFTTPTTATRTSLTRHPDTLAGTRADRGFLIYRTWAAPSACRQRVVFADSLQLGQLPHCVREYRHVELG